MKNFNFIVNEIDKEQRVDAYLVKKLNEINEITSRGTISKYKQNIKINGITKKPSTSVKTGDTVTFFLPPPEKISLTPMHVEFDIVYEDKDIIVVNKPMGLVVHPSKGHSEKTLVHGILNKIKDLGAFNNELRPGIVHRLDKDTSGLIIIAKNIKSHRILTDMFANRQIKKIYHAIVSSDKINTKGKIDKPIGRHPVYRKKFTVRENGKESLTIYNVLKRSPNHSLVEIDLQTGRTHQIRVHFASIGAPVVGDVIYSKKHNRYKNKGLALVAKRLEFHHPTGCELMKFEIDYPEHFKNILEEIQIIL